MQLPLQITVRDLSLSEAAEADLHAKAAHLDTYYDGIVGCRVVVEGPGRHHRKGPFCVRIDLSVPGAELLEDYAGRQRGAVKSHAETHRARVSRLFPEGGYGFLATPDGREIYFHRHSVLHPGFDRLAIGTEVRFVEEPGEKGPQASTVAIAGISGL